jgi:glutaminyl-peptide cyclotransferase
MDLRRWVTSLHRRRTCRPSARLGRDISAGRLVNTRRAVLFSLTAVLMSIVLAACGRDRDRSASYDVTDHFSHDSTAYTQGLVWADSVLFESTGQYGHSDIRRVDLRSGRVLASRPLPADRFGEGLALLKGRLYQLTWKEGVAYTYDAATLTPRDSFHYAGEGWGLTTDGTSLIMSDGSDSLRFVSPATFQVQRVVHVRYKDAPVLQVNELEYANGEILANVYQTNWVLRIDPATGLVREVIDFADLYPDRPASADVMNGIAIAPDGKQLLLTGKFWPVLFQVRLRSPHGQQ